jgi:hypothetical protein
LGFSGFLGISFISFESKARVVPSFYSVIYILLSYSIYITVPLVILVYSFFFPGLYNLFSSLSLAKFNSKYLAERKKLAKEREEKRLYKPGKKKEYTKITKGTVI